MPRISVLCTVQKLQAAAKENDEQQSQIFRLEVRLAEANKKLEHTADLEKELLHYRYGCPSHTFAAPVGCFWPTLAAAWGQSPVQLQVHDASAGASVQGYA